MAINDNIFCWTDLLRFEHINAIAQQDFTLDELESFEYFLYTVGSAYGAKLDKEHMRFRSMVESYTGICEDIEPDSPVEAELLDDIFLGLKLEAEDMARDLVINQAPWFFNEARRAIE